MKKSSKYSVIVPVYNNEQYVEECIQSIDDALIGMNKEIIIIDDGSTDGSGYICDLFSAKDYIKVIHKKNGGVAAARNCGIDESSGEMIFFVDSDDLVELDYFKELTFEKDEEFVYGGFKLFNSSRIIQKVQYLPKVNEIASLRSSFVKEWFSTPMIFCHNACYKKSIIEKYNIRFDETYKLGEDTKFNIEYLNKIKSYRISNNTGYMYRENSDSAVHQFHENRLEKEENEIKLLEDFQVDDDSFDRLKWYYWHIILQHYYHHYSINTGIKKKKIRKLIKRTLSNDYFRSSILYIRVNGSLDEKIETYCMTMQKRNLYKVILCILKTYSLLKIFVLKKLESVKKVCK